MGDWADRPIVDYRNGVPVYGFKSPSTGSLDPTGAPMQSGLIPQTNSSTIGGMMSNGIPNFTPFTPPDPNQVANTPEAQFALSQGVQALDRSAAAHGSFGSGGAMQELMSFGQGLASTQYNTAFNHALQTSQFNNSNLQTQFQDLLGQKNAGINAGHLGLQSQMYGDQRQDMSNAGAGAFQAYGNVQMNQQIQGVNTPLARNTPISNYSYGYTPQAGYSMGGGDNGTTPYMSIQQSYNGGDSGIAGAGYSEGV